MSRLKYPCTAAAMSKTGQFILIAILMVTLVTGSVWLRHRPTTQPGSTALATEATDSAAPPPPGEQAPRPKYLASSVARPKSSELQKGKRARLPEALQQSLRRVAVRATATATSHARTRIGKQALAATPRVRPSVEALAVARSRATLMAARPRSLFSVGNAAAVVAQKHLEVAEAMAAAPSSKGEVVASAESRDADAEEARERKERMEKRMLASAGAANGTKAAAPQEPQIKGPSREELAAKGLDGVTFDIEAVKPSEFNGDVRDLPQVPATPRPELKAENEKPLNPQKVAAGKNAPTKQDPNVPLAAMPSPSQNFQGLNFNSAVTGGQAGGGWPPDVNGDVGLNHYILSVNDAYAIYNKTGTLLASFTENSLWSGAGTGTQCDANNFGDPVVVYDQFADRWILTNFAFTIIGGNPIAPYYQCLAVSKTSNPVTGGWWLYAIRIDTGAIPANTLGDYPKFGNWNDGCLYMAANGFAPNFNGVIFASLNKADLESGATLRGALSFVSSASDPAAYTLIPSNISGATAAGSLPPAGTPNYFVSESGTAFEFDVRKFTPGPNCGGGGTLSTATHVSQTSYGLDLGDVVPQPSPATATHNLDTLDDRLMQKVQYRRVGSVESLWVTHTTRSLPSNSRPQWAQLNVSGGTIATTPVQQQIYAPDTTLYRWMAAIAADHDGNVAMGYSTSNATSPNFPSIAYSGRLATDTANMLPQTEVQLIAGTGSQTTTSDGSPINRWGDYTSMSIDPSDDCTFWYAGMYYSNVGIDATRNWNTRIGSFKFPSCGPTAVKVKAFTAKGFSDGQVLLEWNTSYEVDNLGYNVYREVGGKRAKINSQLIAGSALMTGQSVALHAGRTYAWSDLASADGSTFGAGVRYWLEDIDVNGKRTMTGPITVAAQTGKAPTLDQSQLLAQLGMSQSIMDNGVGSVPVETRAQMATVTPASLEVQAGLAGSAAFKIGVKSEGWYRIPVRDLVAAGLSASTNPRMLQLYVDGQQVPILVNGEASGKLDTSAAVEFYGLGLDSATTSEHVYWLTVGTTAGQRIESVRAIGGLAVSAAFQTAVERKDRTIYFAGLRNGDKENFFGPIIANTGVTQALNVTNLAAGAASLQVDLQGVTADAHQVQVLLNGKLLGTLRFSDQSAASQSFALAPGLLTEGSNSVQLVSLGSSADFSLIDNLRITYWHKYAADGNQLRFTAQGGQPVALTGFTTSGVRVMDVTDPNRPQELLAATGKLSSMLTVTAPGTGLRKLYAFTSDQAKSGAVKPNTPSNWRQSKGGADYVVITRGDLMASLAPLVNHRRGQGLNVAVVDVEDIFDEFSFGNRSPQALRDFLAFTKANWDPAPRFVLLAGDGTFDYKNYFGLSDNDVVPAKLVDTSYLETSSDDWYVDFNDDGLPDMAIGRLPVRNATEASRMVGRIIGYDSQPVANSALLVSDSSNDGHDFAAASKALRPLLPPAMAVSEIQRGTADDASLHDKLIAALNSGQKVVNYSGHGSVNLWRGNLLTNDDAKLLTNSKNLELFVVMNCLNAYFIDPRSDSLGERLMRADNGGASAVWASSGQTDQAGQATLNQEFYRLLFGTTPLTVGEAAARAKAAVASPDIRRTWTLLGDPAMRLR
jgi:Peptidase family C25